MKEKTPFKRPERTPELLAESQRVAEKFYPNALHETDVDLLAAFRHRFARLSNHVVLELPAGRYRDLALTELERAAMWVSKAVSHAD